MQIYGKTLPEIFADMPWQFRVIVIAGVMFIPFSVIRAVYVYELLRHEFIKPELLDLMNPIIPDAGLMDPSVVMGAKEAYLVYSIIRPVAHEGSEKVTYVPAIMLARANTPCTRWGNVTQVFGPGNRPDDIYSPDGASVITRADWWNETPTIVYDPADTGREYKIFSYRYLYAGSTPEQAKEMAHKYSVIVYTYSTDPVNPKGWSPAEWLFSSQTGQPPEPYNAIVEHHLNDMDPSLKDIAYYTRPSAVEMHGVIFMTLSAFVEGKDTPERVIMVASADHAKTWTYLGAPLTEDLVKKMGRFTRLQGASLFMKEGALYLGAVFGDKDVAQLGTTVLRFADPTTAKLEADPKTGLPQVVKTIPLSSIKKSPLGGGFGTYADDCHKTGYVSSEYSGVTSNSRIFYTHKDPVK